MRMVEAGTLLAVRASRLFDGYRGFGPSTVLVDGGKIVEVDTTGAAPPAHAEVLDLGNDVCLLPGLIDAHTHVLLRTSSNELELARQMVEENPGHRMASAVQAMTVSVRNGFTTIRDLGSEGAGYADLGLRDAAREGMVPGPRMIVAGPAIRSLGR